MHYRGCVAFSSGRPARLPAELVLGPNTMSEDALADHRILRVDTYPVRVLFPRNTGASAQFAGFGRELSSRVRVVTTDRGARGWGHSVGADIDSSGLLGRPLCELINLGAGVHPDAYHLDFALHDLAGRILEMPVGSLLGSHTAARVPCYYGSIGFEDVLPLDAPRGLGALLDTCGEAVNAGHRALKLKIGRGQRWMGSAEGLQRDIEVTLAVRKLLPDVEILVDANDAFSCDGALRYLEAALDAGLFWVEELFAEDRVDLLRVRELLAARSPNTRVADGETNFDVPKLMDLVRDGLVDVLLMDVARLGFTPWRSLLREFVGLGGAAAPHTCCNPLKFVYTAHLAAASSDVIAVETFDAEISHMSLSDYAVQAGELKLSSAAGFGVPFSPP